MSVYRLNPLRDRRWAELVERHKRASVFHTAGWLDALRRTHGYEPVAFTTEAPGARLRSGIVFCDIRSWLTGRRLVSLPFSDHCEPLIEDTDQFALICRYLDTERRKNGWHYIELRPGSVAPVVQSGFRESERFCYHLLDLRPDVDTLFRSFHKDSIQRKIRRAEREGLSYEEGRSEDLLRTFYGLLLITRRRHRVPPQPFEWFRNLATCLGEAVVIRVARHRGRPIAAIVTLHHGETIVYKYGASHAAFHNLGGIHLLFWRTIVDGCAKGCIAFDLGRSELEHEGLVVFKDRWGATRSPLRYWQSAVTDPASSPLRRYVRSQATRVLRRVPDAVRMVAGRLLYRHAG